MAHLRLVIVTPRFWPLLGDGPAHLLRLAESLLSLGHDVQIVTPRWKRSWPEQMMVGPVPLVRLRGSACGGWNTLRWMYALAGWLQESASNSRLDGLLVAGLKHEAYVALGAARRTRLPTVLLASDDDIDWHAAATLGSRIAARCREASTVVAPTRELARDLEHKGIAPHCLCVIPRRVRIPPPRSAKAREDARLALAAANYDLVTSANTVVALAIGRMDEAQRFGDLVRAWRIVTARRPEVRLWIVGDGPERERLYRQIGDLDQRFRVMLPGTFDCLEDLYQATDMFLVPGVHVAPPLALLEAQAAGLPVIAADTLATRARIVHEQTGLLYLPGDFKALAAAALQLVERPGDAVAYGAEAREAIQGCPTPENEAADYVALFERQRSSV
jgi:glycosyltransferase involved in cell wall biosynthesis